MDLLSDPFESAKRGLEIKRFEQFLFFVCVGLRGSAVNFFSLQAVFPYALCKIPSTTNGEAP